MSRHSQTKKQRATAWTDLYRLFICGLGVFLIAVAANGFLDEEQPLAAILLCGAVGLVSIGIAIFAKPKTLMKF